MTAPAAKRVARDKLTLTARSVEALKPAARSRIAWDDRLTGFGVRVQPSGLKSFTRQLAAILERRRSDGEATPGGPGDWVFPSLLPGALGHIADLSHLYGRIGEAGGARFWYHGLRNVFITVAERDLLLPHALTRRLVNHAPPNDVTEGYAADWTIEQLRQPAQRIADRIEALMDRTPPT